MRAMMSTGAARYDHMAPHAYSCGDLASRALVQDEAQRILGETEPEIKAEDPEDWPETFCGPLYNLAPWEELALAESLAQAIDAMEGL